MKNKTRQSKRIGKYRKHIIMPAEVKFTKLQPKETSPVSRKSNLSLANKPTTCIR